LSKWISTLASFAVLAPFAPLAGCAGCNAPADTPNAAFDGGVAEFDPAVCVDGDGDCPPGCTKTAGDTDCPNDIDISGTWFVKISAPGKLKSDIDDDVTIESWIRHFISPTGEVTFNICKLTVAGSTIRTTYPQALVDTLQDSGKQSAYAPIGGSVILPSFTIYSGRTPDGTSIDARPPPFPAGDGDGHPGVTIPSTVELLFSFDVDVYAGLVIAISMSGVALVDATTMTGSTRFQTHVVAFDSTSHTLVAPNSTIDVTTNNPIVPFTATKLDSDGSHDCAFIASR
jgi:hypothetical protein